MMKKIRILHVAQAAGGVDRYIRMLLKYLDKEKFENILVCSQDFLEEDYRGLKGEYKGSASAEGYMLKDGTALNLSDKDQKWLGLKDTLKF